MGFKISGLLGFMGSLQWFYLGMVGDLIGVSVFRSGFKIWIATSQLGFRFWPPALDAPSHRIHGYIDVSRVFARIIPKTPQNHSTC